MPRMLDVSDDVRAEIGDEEADRLLAGENAPGSYDCTSCRTPGDSEQERTSTVLFVGDETAVLAFAHATCIPSQVVQVSEEQLQGAVRSITGEERRRRQARARPRPEQAVLGVTSGLVLIERRAAPGAGRRADRRRSPGPARPGTGDDFLPLLIEQGFLPVTDVDAAAAGAARLVGAARHGPAARGAAARAPAAAARSPGGRRTSRCRSPTAGGRAANKLQQVLVFAAPVGSIGQPAARGPAARRAGQGRGGRRAGRPPRCRSPAPEPVPSPARRCRGPTHAAAFAADRPHPTGGGVVGTYVHAYDLPDRLPYQRHIPGHAPGATRHRPTAAALGHADLRRAVRRVPQVVPGAARRPRRRGGSGLHGFGTGRSGSEPRLGTARRSRHVTRRPRARQPSRDSRRHWHAAGTGSAPCPAALPPGHRDGQH